MARIGFLAAIFRIKMEKLSFALTKGVKMHRKNLLTWFKINNNNLSLYKKGIHHELRSKIVQVEHGVLRGKFITYKFNTHFECLAFIYGIVESRRSF